MNPKNDKKVIEAVNNYLLANDLILPNDVVYEYIIDGIYVCVKKQPVLIIGLPPVSDYSIEETEYTNTYLRVTNAIAV